MKISKLNFNALPKNKVYHKKKKVDDFYLNSIFISTVRRVEKAYKLSLFKVAKWIIISRILDSIFFLRRHLSRIFFFRVLKKEATLVEGEKRSRLERDIENVINGKIFLGCRQKIHNEGTFFVRKTS